jgi:hypothetical protein
MPPPIILGINHHGMDGKLGAQGALQCIKEQCATQTTNLMALMVLSTWRDVAAVSARNSHVSNEDSTGYVQICGRRPHKDRLS